MSRLVMSGTKSIQITSIKYSPISLLRKAFTLKANFRHTHLCDEVIAL